MKSSLKKIFTFLACLVLFLCLMPGAQAATVTNSGSCGTRVTWTYYDNGTLEISGSGAMTNFTSGSSIPYMSGINSIIKVVIKSGVTSIGDYAFSGFDHLSSVQIADSVKTIGEMAFANTGLTSVNVPASVTTICKSAFYGCRNLTEATLYSSSNIPTMAFSLCSKLHDVSLMGRTPSIGEKAFLSCSSLSSITIPTSVTYIGNSAFGGCNNLTTIYYEGTRQQWNYINIGEYNEALLSSSTTIYDIENSYTVSYMGNGGSRVPGNQIKFPYKVLSLYSIRPSRDSERLGTRSYTVTFNTMDGSPTLSSLTAYDVIDYSFINWNTKSNGTGTSYAPGASYSLNASVTLYAQWESTTGVSSVTLPTPPTRENSIGSYTVTLNASGGSVNPTSITVGTITKYMFKSWNTKPDGTGINYAAGAIYYPSENVTFYAQWHSRTEVSAITLPDSTRANDTGSYTVTLDANGGSVNPSSLKAAITTVYTFAGWNTEPDGTGTSYAAGESFIPDTNVSLYAQWSESSTCATISLPTPSHTYIDFNGWSTENDASSGITGSYTPLGNETLYATWKPKRGTCGRDGNNLTWTLNGDGVLTISHTPSNASGSGDMDSYSTNKKAPWGTKIKAVVINPGVTSIGGGAFSNCGSLTSVTIPSSIRSIGYDAFNGCYSLTDVTIPEGVTSISDKAFYGCKRLTHISLPSSVTSIVSNPFVGCTQLASIDVSQGNQHYTSMEGVLFNKDVTELMVFPNGRSGSYVIPTSVTFIKPDAFNYCGGLTNVEIPNSVTIIGDNAFYHCFGLKNIALPENVTYIGNSAFEGCSSLTSVTIPSSVMSIGGSLFGNCGALSRVTIQEGVTSIGYNMFDGCSNLASVTIPSSVTSIGKDAFKGCNSIDTLDIGSVESWLALILSDAGTNVNYDNPLIASRKSNIELKINGISATELVIPEGVTTIRARAFWNCSNILSVTIPSTVESIGYYAFYGCSSIKTLDISSVESWLHMKRSSNPLSESKESNIELKINGTIVKELNIPEGVTLIPYAAFYKCSNIETLSIPEGVTSVGDSAFYNCSNLTSVEIPESVTSIGDSAFYNCSNLTSLEIPEGVTSVGDFVFYNCSNLTSVEIPESVTSIGNHAFFNCSNLTNLKIPEGVTSIGDSAFYNCSNLTSVTIPGNLTSIGNSVFSKCTGLTNILLPEGVTSIGNSAFCDCTSLISVTIPASVTSIETGAFSGCNGLKTAGPIGSGSNIELGWTSFIPSRAFSSLRSLTNLTIPEGITSIGSSEFANCSSLTSITIPSTVVSIGDSAFYGCSSLTSVEIPKGVTSVGNSVFYNCSNLTSVEIPEGVTSIGNYAFYNCSSLTRLTIPSSLRSIGDSAFYDCRAIDTLDIGSVYYWVQMGINSTNSDPLRVTYKSEIDLKVNGESITELVIPEGVTWIRSYAFLGCSNIQNVIIPSSVTSIGICAFAGCSRLEDVMIPAHVTSIKAYAFSGCSSLKNVTIPSGVADIENSAFYNCSNLENVTIMEGVKTIWADTFRNCSSLKKVVIPNSITSIGTSAFQNCSSLKWVSIGTGIDTLGNFAFACNTDLTVAFLGGKPETIISNIFDGSVVTAYYPTNKNWYQGDLQNYRGTVTWKPLPQGFIMTLDPNGGEAETKTFSTELGEDFSLVTYLPSRPGYSFLGWSDNPVSKEPTWMPNGTYIVTSDTTLYAVWLAPDLILPASLQTIEEEAFAGGAFVYVKLPDGTESIQSRAFASCPNLKYIYIPESATTIDQTAFENVAELTILGQKGSSAENFARSFGYNFIETE